MRKQATQGAKRMIQLQDESGDFRVEIPADSKITFGPAIPGPRAMRGGNDTYAVRVCKGATEKAGVLAVFPGVSKFRDLATIRIIRPVVNDGRKEWTLDEDSFQDAQRVEKRLTDKDLAKDSLGW